MNHPEKTKFKVQIELLIDDNKTLCF